MFWIYQVALLGCREKKEKFWMIWICKKKYFFFAFTWLGNGDVVLSLQDAGVVGHGHVGGAIQGEAGDGDGGAEGQL